MSKSARPPVDPRNAQLNGPTDLDRQRIRDGIERAVNRGAASPRVLRVDAAMGARALRNAGVSSPQPDAAAGWAGSKLSAAKLVLPALLLGAAAGVFLGRPHHNPDPVEPQSRSLPVQVEDIDPAPPAAAEPAFAPLTEPAPGRHRPTAHRPAHHLPANTRDAMHDSLARTHDNTKRSADVSPVAAPPATPEPATPEPASPAAPAHHLAEELRLMQAATDAIAAKDYARALNLLSDHAERHHDGALAEERRALRVISLCKQGRTHFALTERDEFLSVAPHSPLTTHVREACEAPP